MSINTIIENFELKCVEAEKRYAEERGMLDQTEVGLSLAIFRSEGM